VESISGCVRLHKEGRTVGGEVANESKINELNYSINVPCFFSRVLFNKEVELLQVTGGLKVQPH
jgi:hypothetical protein